jgi:tetratricopeptide (TPR) repeat protein
LAAVGDGGFAPASLPFPTGLNSPRPADERARAWWVWAICGFLLLAVGLVFGQTVRHQFLGFDDDRYVYENPHVTAGVTLSGLWWALTDGPFGEWYPLTVLSQMLDCQLYGLKPAGHYLTNVLLHAASSVLLFLVLLRMTGDLWPSAWVAAVFAIHPLHVESVAWLAERRDMLSGLFFMLTLLAYARYAERPSPARYLAVAGCFALGLMAKPMLVTLPFLLLLLDYWPLDRFRSAAGASPQAASRSWFGRLPVVWRLVVEKVPLMALAAVSCGITLLTHSGQASDLIVQVSLATRLANALVSYAAYLEQSFYPACLAPSYPHLGTHLPVTSVAGALVLLVAITAAAAYCWRRRPYLPVGWLWFSGMLVPVIGLVEVGSHARADRYTYLSQIGLSIALAWTVWTIYRSRQTRQAARWRRWTLAAVSGAAILLLAAVAWRQTSYWRNAETLWTHTLSCTQQNPMAHYGLAVICFGQGKVDEATTHLRAALAAGWTTSNMLAMSHFSLGECLTAQGKTEEALAHYEEAVRIFPKDARYHLGLATALARASELDRAIIEWHEAIRLAPYLLLARLDLADVLLAKGDTSEAIAQCREVLGREPDSAQATVTLATALAADGRVEAAIAEFERAVKLDPRNGQAHFRLGLALYDLGRSQIALTHLNEAIRLQPDNVQILWPAAWILATSPDPSIRNGAQGVELANRAVQLSGGQEVRAFDALAAALAETEKFSAAVEAAEHVSAAALARGDDALARAVEQRIRLYRQGLPYREPASPVPAGHTPAAAE